MVKVSLAATDIVIEILDSSFLISTNFSVPFIIVSSAGLPQDHGMNDLNKHCIELEKESEYVAVLMQQTFFLQ